jgi:hypothetical protein
MPLLYRVMVPLFPLFLAFTTVVVCILIVTLFFILIYSLYQEPFNVKKAVESYEGDPFEEEIFHPCCCPSTYSSSQGCLCESKRIVSILASRGGNRMEDPV